MRFFFLPPAICMSVSVFRIGVCITGFDMAILIVEKGKNLSIPNIMLALR